MNEPLNHHDGGDSMSQTSNQSRSKLSGSLLDRIRAQRGEGPNPPQGQMIIGPDPTPSQISIPNYGPASTTHMTSSNMMSTADLSELGSSSMMSAGGGGGGFGGRDYSSPGDMNESLLGGQQQQAYGNSQEYSMGGYFQTFVMDIYGLFRSLPIIAQLILIIFLLFLVIKWIWERIKVKMTRIAHLQRHTRVSEVGKRQNEEYP